MKLYMTFLIISVFLFIAGLTIGVVLTQKQALNAHVMEYDKDTGALIYKSM